MRRKLWWPVLGVLVAAVAGISMWLVSDHAGSAGSSHAPSRGPIPAADQAPQVAAALRQLSSDPGSLVAAAAAKSVGPDAAKAVPAGSAISPDPSSWAPDGIGGGTMVVSVTAPAGKQVTYAAVMVSEDGRWKVLATFPIASPAPSR
jgi:hypothetical protein